MKDVTPDSAFIVGLKEVINRKFASQAEFVGEGDERVTSRVNLSNVLKEKGGTSEKMREKLAERAGMSVQEIINLGKQIAYGNGGGSFSTGNLDANVIVAELSGAELLTKVAEINQSILDTALQQTRIYQKIIKGLTEERDKLIEKLHQEKSITNTIGDSIVAVRRDFKIVYCNRAFTENTQMFLGDTYDDSIFSSRVHEVFTTGKVLREIIELDKTRDINFSAAVFYPVLGKEGLVDRVIIVAHAIDDFLEKGKHFSAENGKLKHLD